MTAQHNIVVIGGGGAGLRAAIAIAETNPHGGMVTALVAPVLLLLFGLAFPLGWLDAPDHGHLLAMVRNPITKLVVLVLVVLALFHAAHRFRFVLDHGLQLGRFDRVIALWCYGMAVLGSATAGWMLLTM